MEKEKKTLLNTYFICCTSLFSAIVLPVKTSVMKPEFFHTQSFPPCNPKWRWINYTVEAQREQKWHLFLHFYAIDFQPGFAQWSIICMKAETIQMKQLLDKNTW